MRIPARSSDGRGPAARVEYHHAVVLAVILPLAWSLPPAVLVALGCLWYLARLLRPGIPGARRWVRAVSMAIVIAVVVQLVLGLSVYEKHVQQLEFVMAWTGAVICLMLLVVVALVDGVVSLRHIASEMERDTFYNPKAAASDDRSA